MKYSNERKWLKSQGWQVYPADILLLANQLDEIPYKPQLLITKNGDKFFVVISEKDEFFLSKTEKGLMTGLDLYKYEFLKEIKKVTGIPSALLFTETTTGKRIFNQITELQNPILWHRSNFHCDQHKLDYSGCWRKHAFVTKKMKKRKKQPMAMWPVENFKDEIKYQAQLI